MQMIYTVYMSLWECIVHCRANFEEFGVKTRILHFRTQRNSPMASRLYLPHLSIGLLAHLGAYGAVRGFSYDDFQTYNP
jgi:hypothetical protein